MKTITKAIKFVALTAMAHLAMTGISSAQIDNADLSNLVPSVGTLSPTFASGTTAYTAPVGSATTSVTVTPTAVEPGATITVNTVAVVSGNPSGAINLDLGPNVITIQVTAEDAVTTKTYTLTVNRGLVIHESFAQTAGILNGKAGGTGLDGNWTTTTSASAINVVTPSSMVFGGLAMSNGHANLLRSGNTNGRVVRSAALANAGLLSNNAELWFSLIVMKTAGGGNNEWSGFAFGTSHLTSGPGTLTLQGGNGLGFLTRDANVTVGTWNATTTPATGGSLALTYNVPSLIVGKINWGADDSAVETITLYKPTPDLSDLGTGVAKTMPAVNQSAFNTISFSLRDVDTMNYDEIRFGATQADVMPVDTVAPTLLSITDNMAGGPIGEDVAAVTYTLTFDKHMDISTITAADFDYVGTATATVGTVAQVSQAVITVQLLPTTPGTLQLRIPLGSELKSFANLALDTDPAILDDTTITIDAGTTPPGTPTANRWWDGATTSGVTNGASAGGAGTWSTTNTNWDRGAGFEAPVAWNNSDGNTAIFGGTTGTGIVTLDGNITLAGLTVNLPSATGSVYSIGNVGEDNTLTFSGAKTVTTTATGTGTNQDVIIRAGIAGSPTMNINGRLANSVDQFSLLPGSGVTQTIGTLNMLNTFASNKRLILGGTSTGNVVDTLAWATTANQLMLTKAGTGSWTINNNVLGNGKNGKLYVEQGTLTLGGTSNFFTHKVGVATTRESNHTASGTASKLIAKGTFTIGDNREWFYVQNLGTLSPGPGVATLAVTWNANSTSSAANGAFNMQTGSTYEWDVASNTSTDVINVTTGLSNNGNLILGNMTIKVNDAGVTTPIAAGDQLPVFTYETGAQTVARSLGTVTIDTSALGAGWGGTASLVDNGTGTIYITGLTFGAGPASPYDTWASGYSLQNPWLGLDPALNGEPTGNPDGDTFTNLQEFAFAFNPTVSDGSGPLTISGVAITQNGPPQIYEDPLTHQFFLRYTRRTDYVASGLTYTAQFAADSLGAGSFENVTGGSVVATGTGAGGVAIEAIAIEYPDALPVSGKKARFGRVEVTQTP